MLVKIFKLDGEDFLTSFPTGLHILGRNSALQCNDKRVSRNHASIEITPDTVKLTSTHINPCFLKAANSKTLTILSNNSTTQLNDGDAFAFLPEDFWFKVKILTEETPAEEATKNETLKRFSNNYEDAPPDKKLKMGTDDGDENNASDAETSTKDNKTDFNGVENGIEIEETKLDITQPKDESENSVEEEGTNLEIIEPKDENQEPEDQKPDNKQQETDVPEKQVDDGTSNDPQSGDASPTPGVAASPQTVDNGNPGPSHPKAKRERCWYGAGCYRKNPMHRQDYTHPGDSDYDSDPDDKRPACPYGGQCYRKNKHHRREYQHPPRQAPGKKKRNRKKVDRLNVADSEEMRALDTESEDPFLDDDDSDEYSGDSYDEDSDWEEDSQEVDEDNDNVKRLVKEANRFVKK